VATSWFGRFELLISVSIGINETGTRPDFWNWNQSSNKTFEEPELECQEAANTVVYLLNPLQGASLMPAFL